MEVNMNVYTKLAHDAIEKYLDKGEILNPPGKLSDEILKNRAGIFVSIHLKNPKQGEEDLRGCIGTFLPTKENIALEIIDNAISAATRDYRFSPISKDELPNLEISVDVLSSPEPIAINDMQYAISKLDPQKYGVIVKTDDGRTELLLPDLDGVNSPEEQISICRQKAGISPNEPVSLYRFKVTRHNEQ